MGARKNRSGKKGTGRDLSPHDQKFLLEVFKDEDALVRYNDYTETVYYFGGFINGHGPIVRGLLNRGFLKVVLPKAEPDYAAGHAGRPEAVLGLTPLGREAHREASASTSLARAREVEQQREDTWFLDR